MKSRHLPVLPFAAALLTATALPNPSVRADTLFVAQGGASGNILQYTAANTSSVFASGIAFPKGIAFDAAGSLVSTLYASGLDRPSFLATTVPEPGSWTSAVVGLGGLVMAGTVGRRRREGH